MAATDTNQPPNRGRFYLLVGTAVLGAILAMLSLTGDEPAASTPPAASDAPVAPDFTVRLFDGTTFNLVQHLETDGRPVILNLWASWCAPCRAEMPDFDQFQTEHPGVLVLGIAVSDREELARGLAEELGVSYTLGFDETEAVAAAYPPIGMPSTWFIAPDRTVRKQITGQISLADLRELSAGAFGF